MQFIHLAFSRFLTVAIFYSRFFFCFFWNHLLVYTTPFSTRRKLFRYFRMFSFVYIIWLSLNIFWVSLLSPMSFDLSVQIALSDLSALFYWPSHPNVSLRIFSYYITFFTCPSCLISHPGFLILFKILWEYRFYHWLISLLPELVHIL